MVHSFQCVQVVGSLATRYEFIERDHLGLVHRDLIRPVRQLVCLHESNIPLPCALSGRSGTFGASLGFVRSLVRRAVLLGPC